MNYFIQFLLKRRRWGALLFVLALAGVIFFRSPNANRLSDWQRDAGLVFGTTYHIKYQSIKNYQTAFDSIFLSLNKSLSTYDKNSLISRWNSGENILLDTLLTRMVLEGKRYNKETQGYLDPTIGDVVNAWGFGAKKRQSLPSSAVIDSLMRYVGVQKLQIKNKHLIKKYPQTYLEFNSYAKGYGLDCIAFLLDQKGVKNYMIEIGGEIRCKGLNDKRKKWIVGIDKPLEDESKNSFSSKVFLTNISMATSGNYRKFYEDEKGNKYVHIIDPHTGYPSKSNLLSTVVVSEDCMSADAYATALMAMGLEKAKIFLNTHPKIGGMLLFSDKNGNIKSWTNKAFPSLEKVSSF